MLRLAAAASALAGAQAAYSVTVVSAPDTPVLSYLDKTSPWPQTFNPSWVEPSAGTGNVGGLLVRAQNCSDFTPGQCISCNVDSAHPLGPYFPGSVMAFAKDNGDGTFAQPYLVFAPDANAPVDETYGTEDPRLAYDAATGLYHLFYTCYGKPGPFLCHATTRNPTAPYPGNWTRLGKVWPQAPSGTKSGALLIRPSPPHYLYWGAGTIGLATSMDLVNFTNVIPSFIARRPGAFDNNLVEAGPPPMVLADGNMVFFHNSDNATNAPTGDFWAYNPGWVILDGADPTRILQRSEVPLLSPVHGWEQGVAPYECNVHNVTFLEAAHPVPGQPNTFDVFFGGSDAVIGTARIVVTGSAD